MLTPKRVKWRRQHRGRMRGKALVGNTLTFGEYGLQALEPVWMTNRQIEAARIAMTRHIKRGGKVWIKIFPDKSVTKKPAEVRMGSGKGNPEFWVAVVRPGRVLFELAGVEEKTAREALRLAAQKLPISTKIITRADQEAAAGHLDEPGLLTNEGDAGFHVHSAFRTFEEMLFEVLQRRTAELSQQISFNCHLLKRVLMIHLTDPRLPDSA